MIRAYLLYTGDDGHSHFTVGRVHENIQIDAEHFLYKESLPGESSDWHNDPVPQYVITLSGILEFTMHNGKKFTLHPGEVLLATDQTGSGHQWRLLNEHPWRRVYLVYKKGMDNGFLFDEI